MMDIQSKYGVDLDQRTVSTVWEVVDICADLRL
jgi:hypothetical protein